jgi:hypothetical protein
MTQANYFGEERDPMFDAVEFENERLRHEAQECGYLDDEERDPYDTLAGLDDSAAYMGNDDLSQEEQDALARGEELDYQQEIDDYQYDSYIDESDLWGEM